MTKENCEILKKLMIDYGFDCEIYENYVGRGLNANVEVGIVIDNFCDLIQALMLELGAVSSMNVESCYSSFEDISKLQYDSMGLGTIVY